MGTLLDFANAPRPSARVSPSRRTSHPSQVERSAEVIFFPGVRYEREALELSARIGTIVKGAGHAPNEQT